MLQEPFIFYCPTTEDTKALASKVGHALRGGEVIELLSDLGGGKTTFVKGLARGVGVESVVQSPTFAISQIYKANNGLELHHFDFYRLTEPGIMAAELAESLAQTNAVTVVEWGEMVHDILPKDRITVSLSVPGNDEKRKICISCRQKYICKVL